MSCEDGGFVALTYTSLMPEGLWTLPEGPYDAVRANYGAALADLTAIVAFYRASGYVVTDNMTSLVTLQRPGTGYEVYVEAAYCRGDRATFIGN